METVSSLDFTVRSGCFMEAQKVFMFAYPYYRHSAQQTKEPNNVSYVGVASFAEKKHWPAKDWNSHLAWPRKKISLSLLWLFLLRSGTFLYLHTKWLFKFALWIYKGVGYSHSHLHWCYLFCHQSWTGASAEKNTRLRRNLIWPSFPPALKRTMYAQIWEHWECTKNFVHS